MTHRPIAVVVFAAAIAAAPLPSDAALPAPQQISSDALDVRASFNRMTPTSGGRILYVDAADTVWFYDGTNAPVSVQTLPAPGEQVADNVFMLGSGASPSQVIGGWRRGAAYGNVTINGATPAKVTLNPESVSVRDGCVFMVLQTGIGGTGQHAFKIDPADGTRQQISTGTFVQGVFRVANSGCNRAAWVFSPTNADPLSLGYWNGTPTTLDTNLASNISFVGGKIVYAKTVDTVTGLQQVFVIDTDISLTPVQVSAETDPTKKLQSPQTDGRHVAWYRSNADGSNPQLIVNGGLVFPTGPLARIQFVELAFQLDRGQLLWKRTATGPFVYDDGKETADVNPSPATTIVNPWLTDGYIAFIGVSPAGGADTEVFRITATTPLGQPQPPLLVVPTPGTAQVRWDPVFGATSYNAYVAYAPGVTKDNYASLLGGRKITGVTNGFTIPGIPANTTYYVAITAIDITEGPSSRIGSTTFVGNLTWRAVGGLTGTTFFSVAADQANSSYVYAGANGSVYRSSDGGINWTQALSSATTLSTRVRALAVSSPRVFANTNQGDIWRSPDNGGMWARVLDATGNGALGSLAIDPANPSIMYAGNFDTANLLTESTIIKSINGGDVWTHTAQGPLSPDAIDANALATAATTPTTVYAGANGTPNAARTVDGGATWTSAQITGGGQVQSLAVNPANTGMIYASTRDKGVFKSFDSGTNWAPKNNGLAGVSTTFSGGAQFNSILVDPQNPSLLHLGTGLFGYWFSLDGGENWLAANNGFAGTPLIYALAMTPGRRLIAATDAGLYMMSFAPAPEVSSVTPNSGNLNGGASVTISGNGFQAGATVTFGGAAATATVVNSTTMTATTPAHAAGAVDVIVMNPDFQNGTLFGGFTYNSAPNPPLDRVEFHGDFNGDGKDDVLLRHLPTGGVGMWIMNGSSITLGTFVGGAPTSLTLVGVADFNGDGKADILWRDPVRGDVGMWLMNGATITGGAYVGAADPMLQMVGLGDFNGDGRADILWRHPTLGIVGMWFMNGGTIIGGGSPGTVDPVLAVGGVGDFNGDGFDDILWRHRSNGDVGMWMMNGVNIIAGGLVGGADPNLMIAGIGDYNGDLRGDILWRHPGTGDVAVWFLNSTAIIGGGYIAGSPTVLIVASVGDYNGDRKADVLWNFTGTGDVGMWLMNGTTITAGSYVAGTGSGYEFH